VLTISVLVKPRTQLVAQVSRAGGLVMLVKQPTTHVTAVATAGSTRQVGSTARRSRGVAIAPAPNKVIAATIVRKETMMAEVMDEAEKLKVF
jgi:hypothetical protein